MEQTDKQVYVAPSTRMFEEKLEGVICTSDPITGSNAIINWDDGETIDDEIYI